MQIGPRVRVGAGDDIVLVTNVGPTILRSYFKPLAEMKRVARLTVVRDTNFAAFADNVDWHPSAGASRMIPTRLVYRVFAIVKLVARRRPSVLMVMHWFPDGFYLYPLARLLGVPLIAHIIGGTAEIDSGARKLALSRAPRAVKRAAQSVTRHMLSGLTAVTFTGPTTLARFRSRGVANSNLTVIRPVVSLDTPLRPLVERGVDIVFVGRIDADKRFDRFLRVLARLGSSRSSIVVRVCGVTAADVASHEQTRRVTLPDAVRIEYLGQIDDVRPHLRASRLFMLTSDSEGLSLAMLEAMGCGTVPVVTDVGDTGATLREAASGIAIEVHPDEITTGEAIAREAARRLDDDALWARESKNAHAYIRDRHSAESATSDWDHLLSLSRAAVPGRKR